MTVEADSVILYTPAQAAARLDPSGQVVTEAVIRAEISRRRLEHVRIGRGRVMISEAAIRSYISSRTIAPCHAAPRHPKLSSAPAMMDRQSAGTPSGTREGASVGSRSMREAAGQLKQKLRCGSRRPRPAAPQRLEN
jgi:hypothetical protein